MTYFIKVNNCEYMYCLVYTKDVTDGAATRLTAHATWGKLTAHAM